MDTAAIVLVLGPEIGVHVVAVGYGNKENLRSAAKRASRWIKQGIAMKGACQEKFIITCHYAQLGENCWQKILHRIMTANDYIPSQFRSSPSKYGRIIHSLVYDMAMYKSYATKYDLPKHYFTLTMDQFELLWTHQYTSDLWVCIFNKYF